MPPLEDIYIYEMDRATSRLEHVRTNPTRSFVMQTDRGMALYTWQNGDWYDTGNNLITDPIAMVPEQFRREIEEHPVTVTSHAPAVTAVCRICGDKMNQSDLDTHYLGHYTDAVAKAGAIAEVADKTVPKPAKHDANQHARG